MSIGVGERSHEFGLPRAWNLAVSGKGCVHVVMSEVLGPSLKLLLGATQLLAQPRQRLTKAVRVRIGDTGPVKRFAENIADRLCISPMITIYANDLKPERLSLANLRRGK